MSGVLMFASIMHYAEKSNFPNIPIAIWWALVTMTTVGYGDKYPIGYIGYGVGCFCVICGVLVIAFTVPIVVNNFSLYYSHAQTRTKLPNRKKFKMMRVKERMKAIARKNAPRYKGPQTERRSKPPPFSEIPAYTPRSVMTSRDDPPLTKRSINGTSKQAIHTGHQHTVRSVAPVEKTELEDMESVDSGISPDNMRKVSSKFSCNFFVVLFLLNDDFY